MGQYFIGLDLGQSNDYSALAIVREHTSPGEAERRYDVPWLQRFPLGMAYPAITAAVGTRLRRLQLLSPDERRTLVVDRTGVGAAVCDLLRAARLPAMMYDVTITGGDTVTRDGSHYRVPKRDLVGAVQVPLQAGRLHIARALPEVATLTGELLGFQYKIAPLTAHDSYGAWRENAHDDLVLAVALGLWAARRLRPAVLHSRPGFMSGSSS